MDQLIFAWSSDVVTSTTGYLVTYVWREHLDTNTSPLAP